MSTLCLPEAGTQTPTVTVAARAATARPNAPRRLVGRGPAWELGLYVLRCLEMAEQDPIAYDFWQGEARAARAEMRQILA